MTGCRVCWLREHGALHGPIILIGPKRAHERFVVAFGVELAQLILSNPEPSWWQRWLLNPWPVSPVRVKARIVVETRECPVGRMREWPPEDPEPAA